MANLQLLNRMVGTWEGEGICQYLPTVPVVQYLEQLTIRKGAKPIVFEYRSSTQNAQNGHTLHVETGFFRCPPNSSNIELVAAHPFGLAEISEGVVEESTVELTSSDFKGIVRASSSIGSRTTHIVRRYRMTGEDSLEFTMEMATNNHDLQNHLTARLKRVS